ncbi:MAG: hypothetical protein QM768_10060 [Agriterribacter sp.]
MKAGYKMLLLSVFSFAIGILASYLFSRLKFSNLKDFEGLATKISGDVPIVLAKRNIQAYQEKFAFARLSLNPNSKTKGILHDTTAIKDYYEKIFKPFVSTHTRFKPGFHHWEIGLYPNVSYDPVTKKNRLNIYFIPTMVKANVTNASDIAEYYSVIESRDSIYYESEDPTWIKLDKSYIFDQGTIFP